MVRIIARKGDLLIADETGTTTLPQGKQITRDYSESHKKKKRGGGAVPAAKGPVIDSAALVTGGAVGGGLTTWVLMQGDDPVSPSKFK
jgi:hypothetical protein